MEDTPLQEKYQSKEIKVFHSGDQKWLFLTFNGNLTFPVQLEVSPTCTTYSCTYGVIKINFHGVNPVDYQIDASASRLGSWPEGRQ